MIIVLNSCIDDDEKAKELPYKFWCNTT